MKKLLILYSIVFLGLWIFTIYHRSIYSIEKPIFFKHIYAQPIPENKDFLIPIQMFYIAPKKEHITVSQVKLKDNLWLNVVDDRIRTNYHNYYDVHEMILEIPMDKYDQLKGKHVEKITVMYTNGQMSDVEIGDLYFYPSNMEKGILDFYAGGSSSAHEGFTSYKALSKGKITEIILPLEERYAEYFTMTTKKGSYLNRNASFINRTEVKRPSLPIQFEQGEYLTFSHKFDIPSDSESRFNVINIIGRLIVSDGINTSEKSLLNIDYIPSFTLKELKAFVLYAKGDHYE